LGRSRWAILGIVVGRGGGLFEKTPKTFNVILTNPPFGGKEGKDVQKNYAYATASTLTFGSAIDSDATRITGVALSCQ
jgi:methylase of polypeptide subunit release factors